MITCTSDEDQSSSLGLWTWLKVKVLVSQLCVTLCNPVDCSPPGSSVHGTLQARKLEWAAITLLLGIFLIQESNAGLLHGRRIFFTI